MILRRIQLILLAAIVALIFGVLAVWFTSTHRVNKIPYEASLFVKGQDTLLALGISHVGWQGNRIQDLRWKLVEFLRLSSYVPTAETSQLRLWHLNKEGCPEFTRFNAGTFSIYPVNADLLLKTRSSIERWTSQGFEKLTQAEQQQLESTYQVLGEASEGSDWTVRRIELLTKETQRITFDEFRVEHSISSSGFPIFPAAIVRVEVFREGDMVCGIREDVARWEAISPDEYGDLFGQSTDQ